MVVVGGVIISDQSTMKLAVALVLAAAVAVASGASVNQYYTIDRGDRIQKIVGGSETTINQYPFGVALLHNNGGQLDWFPQSCGGSILTSRTILTCAHCFITAGVWHQASWWRARVGSTYASSGGTVLNIDRYTRHPEHAGQDFDLAILRTASPINYIANTVAPASIAGPNYNLADNEVVWAIGWGAASQDGPSSEQLRHVQIWTISHDVCRRRYGQLFSDNMLCSGWLDVGGRDQCQGDSGSPLLHHNVVVGVFSWGLVCGNWYFPSVNVRVSRFSDWIVSTSNSLQMQ